MINLNLTARGTEQELVKRYLEENASETLAEKINNGIRIEKDEKVLISKKTLDGFMKYAADEAKKLAEKGASSACVRSDVVFGWAVHYFEEDSIEGKLYNEDGSEYKPPKREVKRLLKILPLRLLLKLKSLRLHSYLYLTSLAIHRRLTRRLTKWLTKQLTQRFT